MRASDVRAILLETGMPVAYRNWVGTEGGAPPPRPYLVYYSEGIDALYADEVNYVDMTLWCAELYMDQKNEETERLVEHALAAHEISYSKQEVGPVSDGAPLLIKYRFQTI